LFVHAARAVQADAKGAARARSAAEEFLSRRLEVRSKTEGRFVLNESLTIPLTSRDAWRSTCGAQMRAGLSNGRGFW
jgi:hypothetical protein